MVDADGRLVQFKRQLGRSEAGWWPPDTHNRQQRACGAGLNAAGQVDAIVSKTQELWDDFSKHLGGHIAQDPDHWRLRCDQAAELAQELVRLPDQPDPQPEPPISNEIPAAS